MHGLVYEYQVDPARVARFEEMHALTASGRGSEAPPAIWGTELLRDSTRPGRYLVIDRWISAEAAARFLAERAEDYERRSRDTAACTCVRCALGLRRRRC
jgi:quinol monooxygenase YgiN